MNLFVNVCDYLRLCGGIIMLACRCKHMLLAC